MPHIEESVLPQLMMRFLMWGFVRISGCLFGWGLLGRIRVGLALKSGSSLCAVAPKYERIGTTYLWVMSATINRI